MSIICVLQRDGETWIASDTIANANHRSFESSPKWIVHEGWAMGVCGCARAQDVVEHQAAEIMTGTAFEIALKTRKAFLDDGFKAAYDKNDAGFPHFGQDIILASTEGVWSLDGSLCCSPVNHWFFSDGSGFEIAMGAVYAADKLGMTEPEKLVTLAIEAAIDGEKSCGGEIWVRQL